jgi:transcriptional regulator with XRE-family HTH domain
MAMPKSLFTDAHRAVVGVLIEARQEAGVFQADLAQRVGKDQSYVSNIERCQRRIDMVEFYDLAKALGQDPVTLFERVVVRIVAVTDRE